jgi:hypothetical protein
MPHLFKRTVFLVAIMRRYSYFIIFFSVGVLAYSFESFAQNQSERQELLAVWAGMLPIILSAPHGGRQSIPGVPVRSGAGVTQFATGRDNNTDELAETIAVGLEKRLNANPFLVVARFERKYLDANRPTENAYESREAKPYYDGYHDALREAHDRVGREWDAVCCSHTGQEAKARYHRGTGNGSFVVSLTQRFGMEAITGPASSAIGADGVQVLPQPQSPTRRAICGWLYRFKPTAAIMAAVLMRSGWKSERNSSRANLERTATDLAETIAVFAQAYLPLVNLLRRLNP